MTSLEDVVHAATAPPVATGVAAFVSVLPHS
jgi:hypothetical protein